MSLQKRISDLISQVSTGMYEREEIVAVSLLGALCGQNTFLYGPPGTAKSLISRRIACAFKQPTYFEYLMNRFSTPEEVFGPVSIKALKEDHYIRKTDHYLPKAEFAFLDEIWKSSPAILNTLLTLINEGIFRNGESIEQAPLKALIAASNETPDANQGLEALYDRFIVRLMVGPIRQPQHFEHLLQSQPASAKPSIDSALLIQPEEWLEWLEQIHEVQLSKETLTIIHLIREALEQRFDELEVYVSDRRWQRAAMLMKAAAFFNERNETNHSDAMLLQHCLWTHEENRDAVTEIVTRAVQDAGFDSGVSLVEKDLKKEALEKEIYHELFYSEDIYDVVHINGEAFFEVHAKIKVPHYSSPWEVDVLVPYEKMKSTDKFHPVTDEGEEITDVTCHFDEQGACTIDFAAIRGRNFVPIGHRAKNFIFHPKIMFHKGDKKQRINKRLVGSLTHSVTELREQLTQLLKSIEMQFQGYDAKLASPFVTREKVQPAIIGISTQIEQLKLRIADCERLEALCS